jgi:multidrug efflux pump subunit AcrB
MSDTATGSVRGPIAWMARNGVAANLLMVVLLAGGALWATRIKKELFPEFDLDQVIVSVPYPGASPEEVEQGIVLAIEQGVQGLDGVEEVTAQAREGLGIVNIEMITGGNIQKLADDVQSEVARITSFPDEAEEPTVTIASRRREVVTMVLYGDQEELVLREVAERVRDTLLQDPGITQVDMAGIRPLEIGVDVPMEQLRRYGLTLADVAAALRVSALELPGGGIKTAGGELLVRVKERRDYGHEFATIPVVTGPDGTRVLLGELATIRDAFADEDRYATFNGKPAIMVSVYRVGDQTPISVSDAVRRHTDALAGTLPDGLNVAVLRDLSDVYRQRLALLLKNGAFGLALVFVMLGLFLELRLAFWVTMGIPISFLGAMLVLPSFAVSINMISLFAFIIALGIVVDDAIVVGENIYHHHQTGLPFGQAAVRGAREICMPVTFSVLTNIVTFVPLALVPGIMGKIFRNVPAVVISVFLISLAESLLILPAHLGHQRDRAHKGLLGAMHRGQQRFSRAFLRWVADVYGPFVRRVVRFRYTTLAAGLAILVMTVGYVRSGRLGMTLFPKVESDYAIASVVLPYGSAVERTQAIQHKLQAAANRVIAAHGGDRLSLGVFAEVGGSFRGESGGHVATVQIQLTEPGVRPLPTAKFVELWRQAVGAVAGVEALVFESDRGGPGGGAGMTVELTHPSLTVLEQASAELAESFAEFPNVSDINDGFSPGKRQFDFRLKPEGRALGLTAAGVARQVRDAFYGAEVLRQQRGRNEVKVMVRLPEAERVSAYDVDELVLRTPAGGEVPLRDAVTIERGRSYTTISRRNGRRAVSVTADVRPRSKAGEVLGALTGDALPALVRKYPGLQFGFEGRQADMQESLSSLKTGMLLALFVIYAMLAVPFKSYVQPLIVMISIPFGIVGAVLGHVVMGYSLSILSMFGIVALSGVVVNDSLVMIDFANRERLRGSGAFEAITRAGVQRFRPIMLTTLTTFGGLAPMIFETSRQARFLIPMAISLGYGILFATLITLVLVPSLYVIVDDMTRGWRKLYGR